MTLPGLLCRLGEKVPSSQILFAERKSSAFPQQSINFIAATPLDRRHSRLGDWEGSRKSIAFPLGEVTYTTNSTAIIVV
jgi:hypothetical protein